MKPDITVQIDSLEVRGIAAFDAEVFGASFDRELTALIALRAPLSGEWRVGSVVLQTTAGADSSALGIQVAQTVYGQMTGGGQ